MRQCLALVITLVIAGCGAKATVEKAAPDFKVIPLSDQARTVTLADFKGKVVLMDFWATWCGPCREAMPEVDKIWQRYHDKGVEVVAISNEKREDVLKFHQNESYKYPIYLDKDESANFAYGVEGFPTFKIIKNGKIVWESPGYGAPGELTDAVENALR
jgi:thiol-disulfide isomerase/thioredoxin